MNRASLADRAYEELRSAIVGGRLVPGTLVVETDLAEMLGVSRTPVREALLRLELEGYLMQQQGGRLAFHWHTRKSLDELYLVRETLEGYAAQLAAARISDRELEEFENLIEADLDAFRHHRIDQLAALNEQIHGLILEASRNRTLRDLVADLRERIHGLALFAVGRGEDQHRFVQDHTEMGRLLREGDGAGAAALMRHHIRSAEEVLLQGLESEVSTDAGPIAKGGEETGSEPATGPGTT
jgi:DNA-binding GntR family transcriptional regulator